MSPFNNIRYTRAEIEEIVALERLHLYNHGLHCGAQAIRNKLFKQDLQPLPSLRTINRILSRRGLTHGRTGFYENDDSYLKKTP